MKNSLNTRLKMALLLQSGESGFAIVIAVALGLIMLMVGLTMILRSQNDQTIASTQKQTEETVAIAEKGVAYYTSFLNRNGLYRRLATFPDCRNPQPRGIGEACNDPASTTQANQMSWSNAINIPGFNTACSWTSSGGQGGIPVSTAWRDVDDPSNTTTPGIRQFRLVSYTYGSNGQPGTAFRAVGRLIVEGRITQSSGSNIAKSSTRLQVDIPVRDGDIFNTPVPGVWVGGTADPDGTGSSNINGDVLVNNCNISASDRTTMEANIQPPNTLRVSDIAMPTMPTEITNMSQRVISSTPQNPATPGSLPNPFDARYDRAGFIPLPAITNDITLPDNSENFAITPNKVADGRFRLTVSGRTDVHAYRVPSIGGSNTTVTIRPGARVAFLLDGDIDRNVNIQCDPNVAPQSSTYNTAAMNSTSRRCNPLDIMIFGRASSGNICINGNRIIQGFVFAPTYVVGVAGGGSISPGNFQGVVWANQWAAASGGGCPTGGTGGSLTHVVQMGEWNDLPTFARGQVSGQYPPIISPTGTWEKQVAN
jgi:Tfp pilus assembly protein PilX